MLIGGRAEARSWGRGTCERVDDGGLRCGYASRAQGLCGGYSEEGEVDF